MIDVVAALIWQGNRFYLGQRPESKARALLWEVPGGKVEPGETLEAAIVRECQEELAVTLAVESRMLTATHEYPDISIRLTLFNTRIESGEITPLEHVGLRLVTPEEAQALPLCPPDRELIERLSGLRDPAARTFLCDHGCGTCKKARQWLDAHHLGYTERSIAQQPPTREELTAWHRRSGLPLKKLFNTSGQCYRELNLKTRLNAMSEDEQYDLLSQYPMLVKRPLLVSDELLVGFRADDWERIL